MPESKLLSQKGCSDLFKIAQRAAWRVGAPDIELTFVASDESLTRFANNAIHQNVSERSASVSVRALVGKRTARATTNRLDREGIEAAVANAVSLTKQSAPDPDLLRLNRGSEDPIIVERFDESVANCSPTERAEAVKEAIAIVEGEGQVAAGIYSTGETVEAILNSEGLSRYHAETHAVFSITATASDSSGWAKYSDWRADAFDIPRLAKRAAEKARLSANPRELAAGDYTVVLEPAAVLDLVGQMFGDFSGTSLHDHRSFLNERLGTKIFGDNINIWDDVAAPGQTGAPFDGEGVNRQAVALVENGVPTHVVWSRAAAVKAGERPTGHGYPLPNEYGEAPANITIAGGNHSVEDLVKSVDRGILVTRLWYIREVEPYEKIMTGMTRDGTFLIEDGGIVCGLRNFRFNQSVIELLKNVVAMSASERASGEESFDMVVPAMKVDGFHFTEVTTF